MNRFTGIFLGLAIRFVPYELFNRTWAALMRRYMQRAGPAEGLKMAQGAFEMIDVMGSRRAASLVDDLEAEHWRSQSYRFFQQHLSEARLILHLGCGQGSLSYNLATQTESDILACSASDTDIDAAQKFYHHQNLRFIRKSELMSLELRADVIILTDWVGGMPNVTEWPLENWTVPGSSLMVQLYEFPHHWWQADAGAATSICVEVETGLSLSDLEQRGWVAVGQWRCFGTTFVKYDRR